MNSLGNLSQCMVDSDPEVLARARRLRRRAIVISVILEALLLAAMLLVPLVTPGVLPHRYIMTPVPPYRGGGGGGVSKPSKPAEHRHTAIPTPSNSAHIRYRPNATNRAQQFSEDTAPNLQPGPGDKFGFDFGPIGPPSMSVPWSTSDGAPLAPPHMPAMRSPLRQRRSEGIMAGSLIHRVEPIYPRIAIAIGLSGTIRLRAIIATDGTIQDLEVLSGSPILARAAEEAVRQWRYRPTLLSGTPVEVETYITVNFVLSR